MIHFHQTQRHHNSEDFCFSHCPENCLPYEDIYVQIYVFGIHCHDFISLQLLLLQLPVPLFKKDSVCVWSWLNDTVRISDHAAPYDRMMVNNELGRGRNEVVVI